MGEYLPPPPVSPYAMNDAHTPAALCLAFIRREIARQRAVVENAPADLRDALEPLIGVSKSDLAAECPHWTSGRGSLVARLERGGQIELGADGLYRLPA